MPRLSVIIVTYNSRDIIGQCLRALEDTAEGAIEIIVVDNHSADDTVALVKREFPSVYLIEAEANLGFAGGVKLGVSSSAGEAICLLNPDAVAKGIDLLSLSDQVMTDDQLGIVAPLIVHPAGRLNIVSAGRLPTLWRMTSHYFGISHLSGWSSAFEGHYFRARDVKQRRTAEWVTGACMVFRRDVWQRAGGLSDRWFMYAEDVEYCFRVGRLGLKIEIDPAILVTHDVGGSSSERPAKIRSDWVVNLYDFYAADLAPGRFAAWSWKWLVGIGLGIRAVVYGVRGLAGARAWTVEAQKFIRYAIDLVRA